MDIARTYVLKVWTPRQGGFRASLRAVDQDGARWFDSAEALARHLRGGERPVVGPAVPADEAADLAAPDPRPLRKE
ncbi:MAG: hypothetical protein KF683_13420 [Rubrivivax sp.]|nr:hypothetical protein [Rubrivivax sp.]